VTGRITHKIWANSADSHFLEPETLHSNLPNCFVKPSESAMTGWPIRSLEPPPGYFRQRSFHSLL
jgi:hypothetical protein